MEEMRDDNEDKKCRQTGLIRIVAYKDKWLYSLGNDIAFSERRGMITLSPGNRTLSSFLHALSRKLILLILPRPLINILVETLVISLTDLR